MAALAALAAACGDDRRASNDDSDAVPPADVDDAVDAIDTPPDAVGWDSLVDVDSDPEPEVMLPQQYVALACPDVRDMMLAEHRGDWSVIGQYRFNMNGETTGQVIDCFEALCQDNWDAPHCDFSSTHDCPDENYACNLQERDPSRVGSCEHIRLAPAPSSRAPGSSRCEPEMAVVVSESFADFDPARPVGWAICANRCIPEQCEEQCGPHQMCVMASDGYGVCLTAGYRKNAARACASRSLLNVQNEPAKIGRSAIASLPATSALTETFRPTPS